ncbi:AsmA family protein [Oceanisphaera profunda]|uniref:AsmA family protein n=1 Tax=Oceanisphaera profunda TaxID=1416627 RepID=A0A1Y0D875_9GAMM|nr:AsmA family protein [Oceanisphaera profunda]ART83781.1 AsmA family protein [Oceanisphaera profunda]
MKKLLYGLGALLLLILLAGIILIQVVDTDRVKRVLIEQTKEKTGRTLVINGDLSWRFFPSVGFTVNDTALLNPPGFEGGNTLSIGELSLDVALKPLFNNRLEVGEAVLKNARLHLITRKDGVTNLDDLRQLAASKAADGTGTNGNTGTQAGNETATDSDTQAENTASNTENENSKEPMSFSLAGVSVQDAEVVMQNQATDKLTRLSKVNFKLDDFAPDQTVPLSLSGNLFSDDLQGSIKANGKFWLAPEFNRFLLSDLVLDVGATGRAIPGNKQLQLQGQLAYDLDQKLAEFTELNLELGELKVSGALAVRHQNLPELTFKLHTDVLNVDALQEEWRSGTKPTKGKTKPTNAENTDKDTTNAPNRSASVPATLSNSKPTTSEASGSFLQGINLNGDLSADKVLMQGIELEQLDVHIQSKRGKLELKPIQAQLYEGQIDAEAKLDFTDQPTRFSVHQTLIDVNADTLLSAATSIDYIEGRADVTLDAKGAGFSSDELRKNLTGTANISVADGAVEGVNIAALIRRAHAQIKGLPVPAKEDVEKTDFSALTADFVIGKGMVSTDNLHLASPLLRINGEGKTNLGDESLNVLLNTAIVGSIKGQDGEELDELKNIILPIRISGTYKDPQYRLDLQQVFDVYLSDKADKEVERLKRKLDEKLGDKLGDKLPGLLDKLGL